MVALLLLFPVAIALALLVAEVALPGALIVPLLSSWPVYLALTVMVLGALIAAAHARRDNPMLSSAWLFLFCGMLLLSFAELFEIVDIAADWVPDAFELAAFFPLLICTVYVAAPLRILVLSRRRLVLYAALVVALIGLSTVLALAPLLHGGGGSESVVLLAWHLVKPGLDSLLLIPLALLLLLLGGRARPYLFVGIGLLAMLPADLFSHYHLFSGRELDQELAALLSLLSQSYVLIGAVSCVVSSRRLPTGYEPEPAAR